MSEAWPVYTRKGFSSNSGVSRELLSVLIRGCTTRIPNTKPRTLNNSERVSRTVIRNPEDGTRMRQRTPLLRSLDKHPRMVGCMDRTIVRVGGATDTGGSANHAPHAHHRILPAATHPAQPEHTYIQPVNQTVSKPPSKVGLHASLPNVNRPRAHDTRSH